MVGSNHPPCPHCGWQNSSTLGMVVMESIHFKSSSLLTAMVLLESDTIFWLLGRLELQPNPYSAVPSHISELTSSIIWRLLSYLGKKKSTKPMHFQEEIMKFLRNWFRKEVLYGKPQIRNDITTIICRILYIFPADNILKCGIFEDISLLAFATEFEIKHSWAKSVKFPPTPENLNFKKLLILIICAMFKHPGIRFVADCYNVLPGLALLLGTQSGKSETASWPADYKCMLISYVLHAIPVMAKHLPDQYLASGATQKILQFLEHGQSQEITKCTLHCLNSLILRGICPEHFIQHNAFPIVLDVASRLLKNPLTLMNQLLLSHCFILLSVLSKTSIPKTDLHHLTAAVGFAMAKKLLQPGELDSQLDGSMEPSPSVSGSVNVSVKKLTLVAPEGHRSETSPSLPGSLTLSPSKRGSLTAVSSLRRTKQGFRSHKGNAICGFTCAEILLLMFSFSLGVLRFSTISLPYGHLTRVAGLTPVDATIWCHTNMALIYLSEVLAGVVSKTRLGVSNTLIILTALVFIISVSHIISRVAGLFEIAPLALTVVALLFICMLLGGIIHCLRIITLNEFNLPQDYPRFLHVKFFITEFEYIGKTVGAFWVTGGYFRGPSATLSGVVWLIFSFIVFMVALIGRKCFKQDRDSRNIIGDFLKHTFYAVKASLTNKQNEEEFSADDMERIKIVHSVIILYIPIVILIGLKDLKYSRYTWQSLELTLRINQVNLNPQKILMGYPLTTACFLPIMYFVINPYFKKKVASHKTRITTRAIVAFYFMAASLACATILECRIEMDDRKTPRNGTVSIFNFLPCNITVRVFCGGTEPHTVNSLEMVKIPCPEFKSEFDARVVQGRCVLYGKKIFFSMSVILISQIDVMLAVGYDFNSGMINGTYPIYIQHLRRGYDSHGNLLLVHNVMTNHTISLVPAKLTKHDRWIPAGAPVYTKVLSSFDNSHVITIKIDRGRYGIILDNRLTKLINYEYSKTYAILVAHEHHHAVEVRTMLLSEKVTRSVLYQIPQIFMSGLAEMVIESPGFVYGRKKIPIEWRDFSSTIWTFSCCMGNVIIVIATALLRGDRNLLAFIVGSAASVVSIALITIFLLDYFKSDFEDLEKRDS